MRGEASERNSQTEASLSPTEASSAIAEPAMAVKEKRVAFILRFTEKNKESIHKFLKWKGSYVLSGQLWKVEEVFGSQRTEAFYKILNDGGTLRGPFDNITTMESDVSFP